MEIYRMSKVPSIFNTLQNTVVGLIIEKGESEWGMTSLEVDNIVGRQVTWTPLWNAAAEEMTKNKKATEDRNENQLLYQPALVIVFNSFLLHNDGISAADKAAMGIHQRETTTTLVPDPTQAPRVNITYGEALQLIINMRNAATGKIGKPSGVGFMEMWYKIGNPAPTGLGDAILKINIHDTGTAMTFLLSQKGMTVYFFARWVTRKGTYGPWGAYFSAVIV